MTLADVAVDVTPELTPEGFDVDAWIAGVRPTRRAVQLFARSDLIARLDELAARIATADDDQAGPLIDEFEGLRAEYLAGVWWTIEGRSPEWVERFRTETKKALGLTGDPSGVDAIRLVSEQIAAQLVSPLASAHQLVKLAETNAGEWRKLAVALELVNKRLGEKSDVLTLDFSSRRSASARR